MDNQYSALFHHACAVEEVNGVWIPRRFSREQIDRLTAFSPFYGDVARCAAGISLRFMTDARELSFRYRYTVLYTKFGGFDVYENGQLRKNIPLPEESSTGVFTYQRETDGLGELEIFLPANAEVALDAFALGNFCLCNPSSQRCILFYGDSLTQSAYVPTPSLSFPTIAARLLGYDYINRGIGSLFFDETYLIEADTLAAQEVVVLLGGNDLVCHDGSNRACIVDGRAVWHTIDDVPMLLEKAERYLDKMRKLYPSARITVITSPEDVAHWAADRAMTAQAYEAGLYALALDLGMTAVHGNALCPTDPDYRVDGVHFNGRGAQVVGERLAAVMI